MWNTTKTNLAMLGAGFVLMMIALGMVFMWVPTEQMMGIIQRIFYFHVPVAWIAFLSFFIVFVYSILYLWKRQVRFDIMARSWAELGVIFTTLVLISGSIWGKTIWGTWWDWEPRLTSALVMWLIYIAYLLIRSYTTDPDRGARFAAVVGIIGFIDVPIVALAMQIWRTQYPDPLHPPQLIFEGGLAGAMLATLLVALGAFTLMSIVLVRLRTDMRLDENELQRLKQL